MSGRREMTSCRYLSRMRNKASEGFVHGKVAWDVTRGPIDQEVVWVQGRAIQDESTGIVRFQGARGPSAAIADCIEI